MKWLWISHPKPAAATRVYCFGSAGAGARAFRLWGGMAPETIEIAAIQLPGREDRIAEEPFYRMSDAADEIATGIAESEPRPFALFGHSIGARLATHVALHLYRQGSCTPCHIFASGARWTRERGDKLHELDDKTFQRHIRERFGNLPPELTANPEIWAIFAKPLRADFEALETDVVTPQPLPTPLTLVAGARDHLFPDVEPERWQAWSDRRVTVETVDADHFSYRADPRPYLQVLSRNITKEI